MRVYHNGKFWSHGKLFDWIEVDQEGQITKTGTGAPPQSHEMIDLKGNYVLPGLQDAHIHVYSLGRTAFRLNLQKVGSISELQQRLADYASSNPELDWIVGFGWDQDLFKEKVYPSRFDLDAVVPDRPVVLLRACHHIGVVNSKALEILGVDRSTPSPEGGLIDKENGEPTGILREEALKLVTPHIENFDEDLRLKIFKLGLKECAKVGLTSVHTNDPKAWDSYRLLAEKDELPVRVFLTLPYKDFMENPEIKVKDGFGLFSIERVKLFADGSLGASTAALGEPYSDGSAKDPEGRGVLIHETDELREMIANIVSRGFKTETHAIGDRAAEQVLEQYKQLGLKRQILTHCQILSPHVIQLLKDTETIANIQPPFIYSDANWAESRVGSRIQFSYAWKTLLENGIVCAGGSDAPIENPSPLEGLYAAVFRKTKDYPQGWHTEECLTIEKGIEIYTIGAATAVDRSTTLGKLEPGYLADFIVLDHDIVSSPDLLKKANVLMTVVGGKIRFQQDN